MRTTRYGISFPGYCSSDCVQVFLEFYESCRDRGPDFGMQIADLDAFHGLCVDTIKSYPPAHGH